MGRHRLLGQFEAQLNNLLVVHMRRDARGRTPVSSKLNPVPILRSSLVERINTARCMRLRKARTPACIDANPEAVFKTHLLKAHRAETLSRPEVDAP
ncbi:unnamed protein product [Dibothriocephalus latus]|uniref:Uncharacterized protein n=1 Tax=Dibothriocephalus latus TaxID=60516 RepID=A0A3P7LGT5_DIBLA|nr:unnamed protein product [Dibothriocephalus latus]